MALTGLTLRVVKGRREHSLNLALLLPRFWSVIVSLTLHGVLDGPTLKLGVHKGAIMLLGRTYSVVSASTQQEEIWTVSPQRAWRRLNGM